MAVAPEAEALVRQMYDAFNRGDIRSALAVAHPDVTWPNLLEGTRQVGLDNIAEYFERQFRVIETKLEVLSVQEGVDGAVVARVRHLSTFRSDGALVVDDVVEHIFTFSDGLVLSVDARDADGKLLEPRTPQRSS